MRILHVIPGIEWKDGGPSRVIRMMTGALQERGLEVTIATTHLAGEGPAGDAGVRVPLVSFPRQIAPRWKVSLPLAQWLWSEAGGFDLLHLHAVFCYTTLVASTIARRRGQPYVIRPLGTLDPWSLRHRSWRKRPYYQWIERRNLDGAAALQATSEREAANLAGLKLKAPTAVIPLGVELPAAASQRRLTSPLRLLFLGRLHPVKNLPTLIEAMALLRERQPAVTLTIAGDGDAEYREQLRRMVQQRRLEAAIEFAGWADDGKKRELLAEAHVFVLPSLQENFGIAVAEALAAGLPAVLTHEVALAAEVVEAGAGIAVAPGDAQALAQAVLQIAEPERYDQACAAARGLAQRRYSVPAMAAALEDLYRGIVDRTRL